MDIPGRIVALYTLHVIANTSIVPALRAEIIHNDKQWELYHLYL